LAISKFVRIFAHVLKQVVMDWMHILAVVIIVVLGIFIYKNKSEK